MASDEAELFKAAQRRKRLRSWLIPLALLAAGALVALGFHLRRQRTVYFKGPGRPVILHLGDRDPISVDPNEIFAALLRPGTYSMTVEGAPDGLSQVRVPYLSDSTMALPLTSDQCFVVAMADGLYALKGTSASGDLWISQITRSGEAARLPWPSFSRGDFEMDMCHLPLGKNLFDAVYVVEPVSCQKQLTIADAQALLLDRYDGCSLRD